jgi:hypothetical protein
MDTKLIKNSTDEHIDPASEDLQRGIITELSKLESATNDVKFQALTLTAATVGTPQLAHGCKKVKFWTALSDCYVGDASGQPVLLIASVWNEISLNNVTQLRFLSATGGAVYLISTN